MSAWKQDAMCREGDCVDTCKALESQGPKNVKQQSYRDLYCSFSGGNHSQLASSRPVHNHAHTEHVMPVRRQRLKNVHKASEQKSPEHDDHFMQKLRAELELQLEAEAELQLGAEAELRDSVAVLRRARDNGMQDAAWIEESDVSLSLLANKARQTVPRAAAEFPLLVKQFVKLVEYAAWEHVERHKEEFSAAVIKVTNLVQHIDRRVLSDRGSHLLLQDFDHMAQHLIVRVNKLQKRAAEEIDIVRDEVLSIEHQLQRPGSDQRANKVFTENAAPALQVSLDMVAQMRLACHGMDRVFKCAKRLVIATTRAALCLGLETLDARAALEANAIALTWVQRDRPPRKRVCFPFAPLPTIEECEEVPEESAVVQKPEETKGSVWRRKMVCDLENDRNHGNVEDAMQVAISEEESKGSVWRGRMVCDLEHDRNHENVEDAMRVAISEVACSELRRLDLVQCACVALRN